MNSLSTPPDISFKFDHYFQLLSQRSPPKDLPWRIEFEAFGMTIDSDPFTLQFSDEGKPTYLGEKSTARIRASEEEFTRYLKQSALEFKVQTALGTKPETVGCAWVDLAPLASKDVFEIRAAIEIVSKQGKFISRDNRPQLCYIVDVQRSPRFFSKNYVKLEDIRCPGQNFERSREDLTSLEKEMKSFTIQERIPERKAEVVVEADMKKEKILAPGKHSCSSVLRSSVKENIEVFFRRSCCSCIPRKMCTHLKVCSRCVEDLIHLTPV